MFAQFPTLAENFIEFSSSWIIADDFQWSTSRRAIIPGEVGLLHSITGDLSRLERMAVNAERMAIQEINDVGGLLGMKIVPVIADGESDPDVRIRFIIPVWF